jgi:methionyl-tRNA formyltransferase
VTSVYERLNDIQERKLGAAVIDAIAGEQGIPQDSSPSYCCARVPNDGEIDWQQSTFAIDRLIRSLTPPFPGAFTYFNAERLIIARAEPLTDPPFYVGRVPGRVIDFSQADGWVNVLTGDGVLRIFSVVTPADHNAWPAADIIRSTRVTLGLSRADLLRRINELESRIALLERFKTS